MYNIWRSDYTGNFITMPIDWTPQIDGWQFIQTIDEEEK